MADRYGLEALVPKGRRVPQMPEATPTHVIEALLTLAVLQPTIGCRQYTDRLGDQGFSIAKSTVQKHLVANGLGRRSQRLATAAAIAAATTGLVVPDAERKDEPFGFCLASGGPGELICLDSFYIGKLKGVGKVYQLTAIDVFTRFAVVAIVLGTPTGAMSARFIHQALRLDRRHGVSVRAKLQRQWARIHRRHLHRRPGGQGTGARPDPSPLAKPQRRLRALPGNHAPRVLATGLSPPASSTSIRQLQAEANVRVDHLQPPSAQPRRLHARPDP